MMPNFQNLEAKNNNQAFLRIVEIYDDEVNLVHDQDIFECFKLIFQLKVVQRHTF